MSDRQVSKQDGLSFARRIQCSSLKQGTADTNTHVHLVIFLPVPRQEKVYRMLSMN